VANSKKYPKLKKWLEVCRGQHSNQGKHCYNLLCGQRGGTLGSICAVLWCSKSEPCPKLKK
jgi:hypothetical protein